MRTHQQALFRHAVLILRDEDAALDVTQASLLLIARKLGALTDPRWFRAWAYRICTREAVRAAGRLGRERLLFDAQATVETADAAVAEPYVADDRAAICLDAITTLPPGARVVAQLHYRDGLTLIEIAEALELPLGTVKSRLAYALARLRATVSVAERTAAAVTVTDA